MVNYRFLLFVTGIIYILLSLISKKYIQENVIKSILVFACFSILKGIVELFNFNSLNSRVVKGVELIPIIGIFEILVGFNLFAFTNLDENVLRIIFGVWIILDSLINYLTLGIAKKIHIYYFWLSKVVYILGILIGFFILVNVLPLSLNILVSNYFIMFGMVKMIGAVVDKKFIYSIK